MGMELMGEQEHPCPCGASVYKSYSYMDDWNRTKTEYQMLCPACKGNFVLEFTPRGETWTERETYEAKRELEQEIEEKQEGLTKEAENELRGEWHALFQGLKSKKAVHETLADGWDWNLGVEGYPRGPLTRYAFNEKVRRLSVEEAVDVLLPYLLRHANVQQVMHRLGSNNKRLTKQVEEIKRLKERKRAY